MITRFWAGVAATGVSRADFQRHWREVHASYGARLPGLRAYRQNHVVAAPGRAAAPPFDGCSELSWDDVAAMREAFASSQIAEADEDERRFADPDRYAVFVGERVAARGRTDDAPLRILTFLRTGRGNDPHRLAEVLHDGPSGVVGANGVIGHEVFVAVGAAGEPLDADVVASAWFERHEDAEAYLDLDVEVARSLAGHAFGREVALVAPHRVV